MPKARFRLFFVMALAAILASCEKKPADFYPGYIEGRYTYVASPLSGSLINLAVARGDKVEKGDLLFVLESGAEQASLAAAEAGLSSARARVEDMTKGLRPDELAQLSARLSQARAAAELSGRQLSRARDLFDRGSGTAEKLDQARAADRADKARVQEITARLAQGRQGAREDQVLAAMDEAGAAAASVAQARWALDQKTQRAPGDGIVYDTLHRSGGFVPPGSPVAVLLAPENVLVRFFVPEADYAKLILGQVVSVTCDACPADITATVNFISPQPEYTPPIIYSDAYRERLVFLVEAGLPASRALSLHPGEPVEVRP